MAEVTSGYVYSGYSMTSRYFVYWYRTGTWNDSTCGSKIAWEVYLQNDNYWYSNALKLYPIYINGTKVYDGGTFSNYTSDGNFKLASGTIDIPHSDDGTKTFNINFTGWFYSSTNVSGSANFTLETIPRVSSITSVTGSALDSAVTVAISRASTSFVHKVEFDFAGSGWITASSNAGTSCSFTPTASAFAKYIPSASSGTLTVRVTTYNGSTQIGSAVTETTILSLPTSYLPSVELQYTLSNPTAISSWDIPVKGFSSLIFEMISPTASIGSEISSYSITGAGYSSAKDTLTTGTLNIKGAYRFTAKITDKRGRSATDYVDVYIEDYATPSISMIAQRCNADGTPNTSGKYLLVTCVYSYTQIGKNSVSRKVTCNGVSNTSFASGTAFVLAANCAVDSSYIITATISDVLASASPVELVIKTDSVLFAGREDNRGFAFGGYPDELDRLKSYWPFMVDVIYDLAGNRIDINEIKAGLAFYIKQESGILYLGTYAEWVSAGKPSMV